MTVGEKHKTKVLLVFLILIVATHSASFNRMKDAWYETRLCALIKYKKSSEITMIAYKIDSYALHIVVIIRMNMQRFMVP